MPYCWTFWQTSGEWPDRCSYVARVDHTLKAASVLHTVIGFHLMKPSDLQWNVRFMCMMIWKCAILWLRNCDNLFTGLLLGAMLLQFHSYRYEFVIVL